MGNSNIDKNFKGTEIVELPAIIVGGMIVASGLKYIKGSKSTLQQMADMLEGEIAYVKFEATLKVVPQILCTWQGCWKLVNKDIEDSLRCEAHEGMDVTKDKGLFDR